MAGEPVSQSILAQIAQVQKSRQEIEQLLSDRQQDQRTIADLYQYYGQRFRELLSQQTSAP